MWPTDHSLPTLSRSCQEAEFLRMADNLPNITTEVVLKIDLGVIIIHILYVLVLSVLYFMIKLGFVFN